MVKKINVIVLVVLSVGCYDFDSSDQNHELKTNDLSRVNKNLDLDAEFNHPLMPSNRAELNLNQIPFYESITEENKYYATRDSISALDETEYHKFSGVDLLEWRYVNEADIENESPRVNYFNSSDYLENILSEMNPGEIRDVIITHRRSFEHEPMQIYLSKMVSAGLIDSLESYKQYRYDQTRLRAQLDLSIKEDLFNYINSISQYGAYHVCENIPCIFAKLSYEEISILGSHHLVESISLSRPVTVDQSSCSTDGTFISGLDVIKGHQIKQYIDDYWTGKNFEMAMIENQIPVSNHDGYYEGPFLINNRLNDRYDCTPSSGSWPGCYSAVGTSLVTDHPTAVAGILIGDLTNGQDSTITDPVERIERSGYARQADLRSNSKRS